MNTKDHPSMKRYAVHVYVTDDADHIIPDGKEPKVYRVTGEPDKRFKKQNAEFFKWERKLLKK